jgi:hypothetical protein
MFKRRKERERIFKNVFFIHYDTLSGGEERFFLSWSVRNIKGIYKKKRLSRTKTSSPSHRCWLDDDAISPFAALRNVSIECGL